MTFPLPDNETARLQALRDCGILDTPRDHLYDDVVRLAAEICGVQMACIVLIDSDRAWIKSEVGVGVSETPRDVSFCAHTILQDCVTVVPDATADDRFADNPAVTGTMNVRFYLGAPLTTEDGYRIGALCAVDTVPRQATPSQISAISLLARQVAGQIETDRRIQRQDALIASLRAAEEKIRDYSVVLEYQKETLEQAALDLERRNVELAEARDEALASGRAKSAFLAAMSHEIRTPMNGVLGMAALLKDTPLNDEQDEYVHIIQSSGDALLTIINDILDYSKAESGKLAIECARFDLRHTVEDVHGLLADCAARKGLALYCEVTPQTATQLMGDTGRLRQILTNLVGNAIKFTDSGDVFVRVEQLDQTHGQAVIRFEVRDSGIGISDETKEKLFQSFSQADISTTRKYGGTGLGLAICKQLVDLMGGRIGFESKEGYGSTFWFEARMPVQSEPETEECRECLDEQRILNAGGGTSIRVLLAEDNTVNQRIAARMLEKQGHSVDIAANGRQALDMLMSAAYDLVFMDCMMPEVDGLEATRVLRTRELELHDRRRIPVVALTAAAMPEDRAACFAAGMDGYLSKPVNAADLLSAVEFFGHGNSEYAGSFI